MSAEKSVGFDIGISIMASKPGRAVARKKDPKGDAARAAMQLTPSTVASLLDDTLCDVELLPALRRFELVLMEDVKRPVRLRYSRPHAFIRAEVPFGPLAPGLSLDGYRRVIEAVKQVPALVRAALPKGVRFDHRQLARLLATALAKLPRDLRGLAQAAAAPATQARWLRQRRRARDAQDRLAEKRPARLTTRVFGIRLHERGLTLPASVWWVVPVLEGLLWGEELRSPGYDEISFGVVRTDEESAAAGLTHCVFDPARHRGKGAAATAQAFIAALEAGTQRLVRVDHLDAAIVTRCFQRLRAEGKDATLQFTGTRTARGRALITYRVGKQRVHRYALEVECALGRARVDLGSVRQLKAVYCFTAPKLSATGVRIVARSGARAKYWLGTDPPVREFPFSELFQ